jgi:hypothetical protein
MIRRATKGKGSGESVAPEEEVLVDRPEVDNKITRVTGTFCVEATIPTPALLGDDGPEIQDSRINRRKQHFHGPNAGVGIPATYVQATPGIMMGDLLKNMRSSQIFSVCGLPEIKIHTVASGVATRRPTASAGSQIPDSTFQKYQVELLGLDVFDPATMEPYHRKGEEVPAWFLDTDYNGLCFHVSQAFFPRTGAWENLKKAPKGEYEESVWEHLAGTVSAPFEAGERRQVAVQVIDDRGDEVLVVGKLD